MWFWGIIGGLWFGRTRKSIEPNKSKENFVRILSIIASFVSISVGIVAILLSCYFAKQAKMDNERIETITTPILFEITRVFADSIGYPFKIPVISIENPIEYANAIIGYRTGNTDKFFKAIESYIKSHPNDPYIYFIIADWYFKKKDFENSIENFKIAYSKAENEIDQAMIAYHVGVPYLLSDNFNSSLEWFDISISHLHYMRQIIRFDENIMAWLNDHPDKQKEFIYALLKSEAKHKNKNIIEDFENNQSGGESSPAEE